MQTVKKLNYRKLKKAYIKLLAVTNVPPYILQYISDHPGAGQSEITSLIKLHHQNGSVASWQSLASRYLNDLITAGFIVDKGAKRGVSISNGYTSYYVNDDRIEGIINKCKALA